MNKNICIIVLLFGLCINILGQEYSEEYRPQYHFSAKNGWVGDPVGLIIHEGKYHLFWWGHAISEDLVHWKELPYPLKGGSGDFSYFSGSVVVDHKNTSGFGENSMIAVYTKHFPGDSLPETQALSISQDKGLTFNYYEGNPVLDVNKIFFRDPQVFWYEPENIWKMIISVPDIQEIQFYESSNMKEWQYCGSFGNLGAKNSFWECPDIFELPIIGTNGKKKWVILIGRGPNRVQYFVGDFDGKQFTPDMQLANFLNKGEGLDGITFEDFETNVDERWTREGDAFQSKEIPADISDYLNKGLASSFSNDSATGKLVSKPFTIEKNAINFMIAGNNNPDSLCIQLIVDGNVQRTATGDNTRVFKWRGWNVRNLIGKQAKIEIIDRKHNGSIGIDHIMFSNELRDYNLEHALWLDYGNDYYATRTWRNYDQHKNTGDSVFAISWLGNWQYARKQPTSWGKGFQSIPRTMELKKTDTGYRIIQQPISQLKHLRKTCYETKKQIVKDKFVLSDFKPTRNTYEMIVEFKNISDAEFGINLLVGEGRRLTLSYNPVISSICLDRTNCTNFESDDEFTSNFATKMYAPLKMAEGTLRLHLFVDKSSVEIFTNDGEIVLSALTFPSEEQLGIELFSTGGITELSSLKAWELRSIWNND